MVYWYSIVSVLIVGTAVVGSVYLLRKKERQGCANEVKRSLHQSLLYESVVNQDNDLHVHQHDDNDEVVANDDGVCWPRSQQLWTSCWRGLHPGVLLGFRVVSFFVLAFFLLCDIHDWGASIFIYYTEWTYSLVMMYFAIGSVVSAHGCWIYYKHHNDTCLETVKEVQSRSDLEENPPKTTRVTEKQDFVRLAMNSQRQYYREQDALRAGFWGHLMQISYQISAGAAFLTDIIFWCVIVPFISNSSHLGLNLLMGCIHSVNIVFMLLETSINDLPFPWFRLAYFVLWSSLYVIFQWFIHLCGFTWWPYPFLKLSTPLAPVWYLVLAVCHVACYAMYALIVKAKDSLFSKLFPDSYMKSC